MVCRPLWQVRASDIGQLHVALKQPAGEVSAAPALEVHLRSIRGQKAPQWLYLGGSWRALGSCVSSPALPAFVTRPTPDRRNGMLTLPACKREDWAERQAYTFDVELGSSAVTVFQQTMCIGELHCCCQAASGTWHAYRLPQCMRANGSRCWLRQLAFHPADPAAPSYFGASAAPCGARAWLPHAWLMRSTALLR